MIRINLAWLQYNGVSPKEFLQGLGNHLEVIHGFLTPLELWDGTLSDPLCDAEDETLDEEIQHYFEEKIQ